MMQLKWPFIQVEKCHNGDQIYLKQNVTNVVDNLNSLKVLKQVDFTKRETLFVEFSKV